MGFLARGAAVLAVAALASLAAPVWGEPREDAGTAAREAVGAAPEPESAGAGAQTEPWADPDVAALPPDDDWLFEEEYQDPAERDPLEPSNRAVLGANEFVYRWVLDPISDGYEFLVPSPVRRSVLNFFDNLGEPAIIVNELLQLNPRRAGVTTARFFVNTTVGVVGLFDPASGWGMSGNTTDFGETLGVYGIGSGWYLVIPVVGPSTVRDLLGSVVDGLLNPQTYVLSTGSMVLVAGGGGLTRYQDSRDDLEILRESSVDFYAALRGAYLMQRDAGIREARGSSPVWDDGEEDEEELDERDDGLQEPPSVVPASAADILPSIAVVSAANPSRFMRPEYSDLRRASSLTVPSR